MKSFFSLSIYLQGLKKVRGAGIATALTVIIANALVPLTKLLDILNNPSMQSGMAEVSYPQLAPFSLLCLLFAPLVTYSMFSYLNERSKSDFYHSLPQKRSCVFLSFIAAILTWLIATLIVSSLINTLIWVFVPGHTLSALTVIVSTLGFIIITVLTVGVMSLAMTLTGTTVTNFLIGILLFIIFRVVGVLFIESISTATRIFLLELSPLRFFYIDYFLPYGIFMDVTLDTVDAFTNIPLLIYTAIVAIGFIALATLFYCKRRSEMAGRSAPNPRLQHVFRCAITLPFILLLVYLMIDEGLDSYHLIIFSIALLVYVLYELITTKKPKNMLKTLPMFAVPVVIGIAFACSAWATSAVIESNIPDADEISGVSLFEQSYGSYSYEDLLLSDVFVDDEQAAQIVSDGLKNTVNGYRTNGSVYYVNVAIELDSGKVIGRRIMLPQKDRVTLYNIIESAEAEYGDFLSIPDEQDINSVNMRSYPHSMSHSDAKMIWESFREEYKALTTEQQLMIKRVAMGTYSIGTSDPVCIQVSGQYRLKYFHSSYPIIPELMPTTFKEYVRICNNNSFDGDPQKTLGQFYENAENTTIPDNDGYFWYNIEITPLCEDSKSIQCSFDSNSAGKNEAVFSHFKHIVSMLKDFDSLTDYSDVTQIYKIELSLDVSYNKEYESEFISDSYNGSMYYTFYFNLTPEQIDKLVGKIN